MNKFTIIALRTFQFIFVVVTISLLIYFFEGPRQGPGWLRQAENQIQTAPEFKQISRLFCSPDLNTVQDNTLNCQASFENGTATDFNYSAKTRLNTNMVNFEVFLNPQKHFFLYIRPIDREGQKANEQLGDYVALIKEVAVQAKKEPAHKPVSVGESIAAQLAVNPPPK